MKRIVVRHYGLLPPLDWGDDCKEHFYLANKLWNTLVEIERTHQAAWQTVFERDAEYAAMKAELDALQGEIDTAWEERRKVRAKLCAKSTDEDQAAADRIKGLCLRRSELWATMKSLRRKLKPEFKTELEAVELDRRQGQGGAAEFWIVVGELQRRVRRLQYRPLPRP